MTSQLGDSLDHESGSLDNSANLTDSDRRDSSLPEFGAPVQHTGRQGFLPFPTNAFDRVFISVICFVAIHLLWMRFVEEYITLYVATALSLALAYVIIRWG
jgi:predicted small integral membrane protein